MVCKVIVNDLKFCMEKPFKYHSDDSNSHNKFTIETNISRHIHNSIVFLNFAGIRIDQANDGALCSSGLCYRVEAVFKNGVVNT